MKRPAITMLSPKEFSSNINHTIIFLLSIACTILEARTPNIILIMIDDLGYETITSNGGESYKTPYLDKMAA